MAALLLLKPQDIPPTDSGKQELSDMLLLNSLVMSMGLEASVANPVALREFSDGVASLAMKEMGLDLRALELTDQVYIIKTRYTAISRFSSRSFSSDD